MLTSVTDYRTRLCTWSRAASRWVVRTVEELGSKTKGYALSNVPDDGVPAGPDNAERWITKRDLTAHLGMSKRWVEEQLRDGMPTMRIGNRPISRSHQSKPGFEHASAATEHDAAQNRAEARKPAIPSPRRGAAEERPSSRSSTKGLRRDIA